MENPYLAKLLIVTIQVRFQNWDVTTFSEFFEWAGLWKNRRWGEVIFQILLLPATYKPKRIYDQSELKGKSAIIDFNYFKTSKNDRKSKRQKFSR